MKFMTILMTLFITTQAARAVTGEIFAGKTQHGETCSISMNTTSTITNISFSKDGKEKKCKFQNTVNDLTHKKNGKIHWIVMGDSSDEKVCKAFIKIDENGNLVNVSMKIASFAVFTYDVVCSNLTKIGNTEDNQ